MRFRYLGAVTGLGLLLGAAPAWALPEAGWWWNPNESGRGFFVESQADLIYLAGYFYESDGRATWLVAGGPNTDPYRFDGRLLAYANGQTLLGDYRPPAPPTDAGAVSVRFSDDTHGTITWPGGTIPIVRQPFGSGAPTFETHNGWWWNEAESGRGYSVERQGDTLFLVGFMYDDAGHPVWYYSAGPMASETHYSGTWLQFAGGQTLGGPYRPPEAPRVVGGVTIDFTATNEANVEFRDLPAADGIVPRAQKGAPKMITIKPSFKATTLPIPEVLKGGFVYADEYVIDALGSHQRTTTRWDVTNVELELNADGLAGLPVDRDRAGGPWYRLYGTAGTIRLEIDQETITASGRCVMPKKEVQVALAPRAVSVTMNYYGQYLGKVDQPAVSIPLTLTCTDSKGKTSTVTEVATPAMSFDIDFSTSKTVNGSRILAKVKPPETLPFGVGRLDTSYAWSFYSTK
ncbi:MAG: hypothetical protein U1F10_04495 [Burkholderiales bacterium]